jgi:hypothetical protein
MAVTKAGVYGQKETTKASEPDAEPPKSEKSSSSPSYGERLSGILGNTTDESKTENLFLGRAGEFFVAAHLLRRGLNAAPLPIDTGVDLLAHRELRLEPPLLQAEHEIYQYQVKTTATNEYRSSLPVKKVHDLWHKAINLIVVFWASDRPPSAVVLPPSLTYMLTSGGFEDPRAPFVMTGDEVSLRFIENEGRYFIRNLDNEITAMLNRFDLLEPVGADTGQIPSYAHWSDGPGLVACDPG